VHSLVKYHNWLIYTAIHPPLQERLARYARGRLADIGCGNKPYVDMAAPHVDEHVGIDHAPSFHGLRNVDVIGTAYEIPVDDGAFDTILCTDVLEHLEEPCDALREAYRILRPGGYGIYTVPLFWHLHETPRDFYRFTEFGLRHLFEKAGFQVVELIALTGFWVTFGQEMAYYLQRFRGRRWIHPTYWFAMLMIPLVQCVAFVFDKFDTSEGFTAEYMAVVRKPGSSGSAPSQ
jgi:SAM-dependent methyltransferase